MLRHHTRQLVTLQYLSVSEEPIPGPPPAASNIRTTRTARAAPPPPATLTAGVAGPLVPFPHVRPHRTAGRATSEIDRRAWGHSPWPPGPSAALGHPGRLEHPSHPGRLEAMRARAPGAQAGSDPGDRTRSGALRPHPQGPAHGRGARSTSTGGGSCCEAARAGTADVTAATGSAQATPVRTSRLFVEPRSASPLIPCSALMSAPSPASAYGRHAPIVGAGTRRDMLLDSHNSLPDGNFRASNLTVASAQGGHTRIGVSRRTRRSRAVPTGRVAHLRMAPPEHVHDGAERRSSRSGRRERSVGGPSAGAGAARRSRGVRVVVPYFVFVNRLVIEALIVRVVARSIVDPTGRKITLGPGHPRRGR